MQCIFCKKDSIGSKGVEHIIPESLGNTTKTLPPGVVCDKCNNYFASKIEKPFLESGAIKALRFYEAIPSKKRKIPVIDGQMDSGNPVKIFRDLKEIEEKKIMGHVITDERTFKSIMNGESTKLLLPMSGEKPSDNITSRLLAKIAMEGITERVMHKEGGIEYVINENQFNPLREHARYGRPRVWSFYERRIYQPDSKYMLQNGKPVQTKWEYDFLATDKSELYFSIAIFGLELTINIGGNSIDGFKNWLKQNNYASPLYSGKNWKYKEFREKLTIALS